MECNEYKEAIASDPGGLFEGAEHASNCASCAAFTEEMRGLNRRIASALNIPVPNLSMPDLPEAWDGQSDEQWADLSDDHSDDRSNDQMDNNTVVNLSLRRKKTNRRPGMPVWLGMAAGIALAAVLGFKLLVQETAYPSLGAEIMAHLDHEPGALTTSDAVSEQRLANALKAGVAALDTKGGVVTYARTCVIHGHAVPHLVLRGVLGPITLLLLPDEKIATAVLLEGVGTEGVILPVGDGSIAIIGNRGEPLDNLKNQLIDSVKWSI